MKLAAGFLLAALLFAGCNRDDPSPPQQRDEPGAPLQTITVEDPAGDAQKTDGFRRDIRSLDVTQVNIIEYEEHIKVVILLMGEPDTQADYRAWFRRPGETSAVGGRTEGGSPVPADIRVDFGHRNVTIEIPFALARVAGEKQFEHYVFTDWVGDNEQGSDRTDVGTFAWARQRDLAAGVGPFRNRSVAAQDPCCDVKDVGYGRPAPAGGDLRTVWIWQDESTLFIEANTSGPAAKGEELSVRYHRSSATLGEFTYDRDTKTFRKNGETVDVGVVETEGYGVRMEIPWEVVADRVSEDRLDLTLKVWSDGRSYADSADVLYRTGKG